MVKKKKSGGGFRQQTQDVMADLRQRIAVETGFQTEDELVGLFPANAHKSVRLMQQALAQLTRSLYGGEIQESGIPHHYANLINSLAKTSTSAPTIAEVNEPQDPSDHRTQKKAALAAEALRQVIVEAVETPLAMLPSLLADDSLSDRDKINRLRVYADALEMLYEPLEMQAIGEPGDSASFDQRLHESASDLAPGTSCTIKRIGFTRSGSVIRKAVVESKE